MTEPRSPFFYASGGDPEMLAAYERARATFKYLWRELTWERRRIVEGVELSAVKAAFADEGGAPDALEHMWLGEIEFDGDSIHATVLNQPNQLRSVRLHRPGDACTHVESGASRSR